MFNFVIPQTANEKLHFMQHWYRWFHSNTDRWEGKIGSEISYLFGAIMNDTFIIVNSQSALLSLLKKKEVNSHSSIWKYLRFPDN
jgi:hypothetical protein